MKKAKILILLILPILLAIAPLFALAQVATDTIQLPTDFTADILTQSTALLSNLEGFMSLIVGVLLALVVVEFVIGAIRHRGQ
jgi:hypothetical protein